MICCNELWLVFTILTSHLSGMQVDSKIDKYEYDGKTFVPKHVTGCQDRETGILLNEIRIFKQSKEIAVLPQNITNAGRQELWIEFANRCNGKSQCQMNQMKFLKNKLDTVLPSSETYTTIETEFECKPMDGDNVYQITTNLNQVITKVGSSSVYLIYNKTSKNKVECHVMADTGSLSVKILHFEWKPSDCRSPKDRISLYKQDFNCSWIKVKKEVTVPQPQNIPIKFLKQSGFVWLEVPPEVDRRITKLNLSCELEPWKENSSKTSLAPSSVASTTKRSVTNVTHKNSSSTTSQTRTTSPTETSSKSTQTSSNTKNTKSSKNVDTTNSRQSPLTASKTPKTTLTSTDTSKNKYESTTSTSTSTDTSKKKYESATSTSTSTDTSKKKYETTTSTSTSTDTSKKKIETNTSTSLPSSAVNISQVITSKEHTESPTPILIHVAIGVGITAFLVLILVIALCVIYLRQRKREELSINPKRTLDNGVLTMKEDYATSLYTQVDIDQGSSPKDTDQLPTSVGAASPPSKCKPKTFNETQFPDVEYASVNKSKKGSNPMVDPSNMNVNQLPNAEYATVNKVSTMPEKSSLNETQFPNAEYATVNKVNAMPEKNNLNESPFPNTEYASVNKSSNPVLEPSNTNESKFTNQESAVENKETKYPLPKSVQNKSSTLPNYINVEIPNTETPESLYSHLSHVKSADARESENIYNG